MADSRTYTADEVETAGRELRQAAGSEDGRDAASQEYRDAAATGSEEYSVGGVLSRLGDEIRLLRERGFTDRRIADLLSGFDIDVTAKDLANH